MFSTPKSAAEFTVWKWVLHLWVVGNMLKSRNGKDNIGMIGHLHTAFKCLLRNCYLKKWMENRQIITGLTYILLILTSARHFNQPGKFWPPTVFFYFTLMQINWPIQCQKNFLIMRLPSKETIVKKRSISMLTWKQSNLNTWSDEREKTDFL